MKNREAIALDFYRTGGDHSSHFIPTGRLPKVRGVDWDVLRKAWAERVEKLEAEKRQKEARYGNSD